MSDASPSKIQDNIIDTKYLKISNEMVVLVLFGFFALFLAWGLFLNQWLGNTNVGSLLAKNNFEAKYWVYIQPDSANAKNYRLKGNISRVDGEYSISKIYWPNGGFSTFNDCRLFDQNGSYESDGECNSDELINDGNDNQSYIVRVDSKVTVSQE